MHLAPRPFGSAILDVDGVLLASPHERAWREALAGLAEPARFTTAMYQAKVAGRPRLSGAIAALEALGVTDAVRLAPAYAAAKQARLEALVGLGAVQAFPDALRFVCRLRSRGLRLAVASSSKNANAMMRAIPMAGGPRLIDMFQANVCGLALTRGKPDPEIFLRAASALGAPPASCVVVEDAPAGIEAARAGGMTALAVARLDDAAGLVAAGANLVVTSLDEVSIDIFAAGRLSLVAA
jgi:beta-phosphoglucomutase-like phosphatase (HAD superfamily)